MKGICRVCGCTDDNACMTDDGPCHWITMGQDWCSACALEVPADPSKNEKFRGWLIEKTCAMCAHLVEGTSDQICGKWTCDMQRIYVPGATGYYWVRWSGIRRPNKTVKAAQAHCPHWTLYERFREITRKGRT